VNNESSYCNSNLIVSDDGCTITLSLRNLLNIWPITLDDDLSLIHPSFNDNNNDNGIYK
jgi:hypothetical protein